ncbi:MAG TPA: antibiotic biosynthesis monooxygenase family protein [Pseudomonas sp.]|uniref:antibiotic biosynthesis monooxygenase family protein n=1 Tax=Pseudomonas sp. TaxID=306 RepID=UPI002ED9BFE5
MSRSPFVSHHVCVRALAGHSEQLGACLGPLIALASDAQGCLHFALHKSMTDSDLWVISGQWSDEQAMNAWFCSPDLTIFSELLEKRIVGSFDFQTFVDVSAGEAEAAYGLPQERMAG